MTRFVASVLAAVVAVPVLAQVEVMEPGAPAAARAQQPAPARASSGVVTAPGGSVGDLYNQVLLLQEEVMKLRGIVEEQGEQLRQLKQQRLDDYISLDRRLGALGGAAGASPGQGGFSDTPGTAVAGGGEQVPATGAIRTDVVPSAPNAGEEPAYQAAYELVRNRRFPEAVTAFEEFLGQYPRGTYAGNAHYWLGELYLLEGNSASAKSHFEALVYQFSDNRKVPDGMFKLGRIYHQEGDSAKAKELLQRVVNEFQGSDSAAPRLAREYLQQNF